MCNLFEKQKKYTDLYSYVRNSGWFANAPLFMDNGKAGIIIIEAVRDVICNGNRTLPEYIDEHDCLSDISSISTGSVYNRNAYIKDKTIIRNVYGSTYTFFCFPDETSDPFGYTSKPVTAEPVTNVSTDTAINTVINVAKNELGYMEKSSLANIDSKTANAGYGNYTKYWADILPEYQGQPWCACFVSWIMKNAFGLETAKKLLKHWPYVYCPTLASLFTKYSDPQIGDIVVFYYSGEFAHTGIVIAVDGDKFTTIEGNTTSGSAIVPNGGGVYQKTYYNSNLPGTKFCRPDYSLVTSLSAGSATEVNETFMLSEGCSGEAVREMQNKLSQLGYEIDVDGEWGPQTSSIVRQFQSANNLEVDGIAGPVTLAKLDELAAQPIFIEPTYPCKAVVITNTGLYKGNAKKYKKLADLKKGNELIILREAPNHNNNLWYRVQFGDKKGYVYSKRVKL